MNVKSLQETRGYLVACLSDLSERAGDEPLDADTQRAWDEGKTEIAKIDALIVRHNEIASFGTAPETRELPDAGLQVIRKTNPVDVVEDRSAKPSELADAITRSLEGKIEDPDNEAHVRQVAKRHAGDRDWARQIVLRSTDVYASAFSKMITGREVFLDAEERAAIAVGTNTQGGYLVPVFLDPTLIITNAGTSNAIRPISRVVTLTTGNVWNGVTTAGLTASWDAELTEVSDDSPSFDRASVSTHMARAFVQASIESFEDISGLATDVLQMFSDARDRLEGAAHALGAGGATQPRGVFVALTADTNVALVSTTNATVGLVDLHAMYNAVPVRWRNRTTWLMNPQVSTAIKALGTALSASFTNYLTEPPAGRILGRPVVESDDAPFVTTTTVLDNRLILGDFSQYLIVDMPGSMSIEFIPTLFGRTNGLPVGARGWFTHWRTGADVLVDNAFRLLQDRTSA